MPKLSSFAGSSLLQQGGGFEPQRASNFALIIPGLENDETLVLSLKTADIPGMSLVKQGIKYFNTTSNYAGALSQFENLTLGYHDYIDRDVLGILSRWYRKVYCPKTGSIGWARDYKRNGSLFLLPPGMPASDCPGVVESEEFADRTYRIKGAFPLVLKYPELDHDSEGENTIIQLEISVDMAYPKSME